MSEGGGAVHSSKVHPVGHRYAECSGLIESQISRSTSQKLKQCASPPYFFCLRHLDRPIKKKLYITVIVCENIK